MDGIILVYKSKSPTSHDVVKHIRKILNIKKVGHFGTLDPMATGLVIVGVGKATRLFPFLSNLDKVYQGQIRLGFSTDTYDATGKPTSQEAAQYPSKKALFSTMKNFEGDILQTAPPYSAKKYQGKPLYYLARKKKTFETSVSQIHIHYFRLNRFLPPYFDFEVKCSSGTYIRSLAHDLGQDLGCGAHLSQLNRTEVGTFHLRDSHSLQEIQEGSGTEKWKELFIPIESLLSEFPKITLNETGTTLARNGNTILPEHVITVLPPKVSWPGFPYEQEEVFRIFSQDEQFIALARRIPEGRGLHPFLVLDVRRTQTSPVK